MKVRAYASRCSAVAVAAIAAIASYSHMRQVALSHGQSDLIASLLPLSVDGIVTVGAVAIGDGRRHTWSAWLAFVTGVAASVAANVLSARPDIVSRVVSAWPAVALLLVVEVLSRSTSTRDTTTDDNTQATPHAMTQHHDANSQVTDGRTPRPDGDRKPRNNPAKDSHDTASQPQQHHDDITTTDEAATTAPRQQRQPANSERIRDALRDTPNASTADLARLLGVSMRTIQRHRPPAYANGSTREQS